MIKHKAVKLMTHRRPKKVCDLCLWFVVVLVFVFLVGYGLYRGCVLYGLATLYRGCKALCFPRVYLYVICAWCVVCDWELCTYFSGSYVVVR